MKRTVLISRPTLVSPRMIQYPKINRSNASDLTKITFWAMENWSHLLPLRPRICNNAMNNKENATCFYRICLAPS